MAISKLVVVESISQSHKNLGLAAPKHPLVSVIRIKDIIDPLPPSDVRFRIELYNIIFKNGPAGSLGYGRNSYDFQQGTMIFSSPGQVISNNEGLTTNQEAGWMLQFHRDLIRRSTLGKSINNYSFFSYDVQEALHLSDEEKSIINDLADKIEREYDQNIDKHSQKLIISTLGLLLDYCQRFYDRQFYTRINLNKDHLEKFNEILKNYYQTEMPLKQGIPSVTYFGKVMNMSPKYLSDLLKKETGFGAQAHIQDFVIDRAKTELLGTTETISRIAYELGFEYPQHFSKMFKRKVGMSPIEYRLLN